MVGKRNSEESLQRNSGSKQGRLTKESGKLSSRTRGGLHKSQMPGEKSTHSQAGS